MEILNCNNYYLSDLYENSLSENEKKALGIYYTPKYVIDYIVNKILTEHDFNKIHLLKYWICLVGVEIFY
ncbi:hypothetical protein QJS64_18980 [Paraclostridium bifermentans]|uniref:Uncharacterized protein n=1 Tax=Paraclostridium bifermentans TaxID=1490 RepID=A0ABY8R2Y6_PARBF|nr:hypothetical protein QJS64_18980 [Paraclostridium bifermentans]